MHAILAAHRLQADVHEALSRFRSFVSALQIAVGLRESVDASADLSIPENDELGAVLGAVRSLVAEHVQNQLIFRSPGRVQATPCMSDSRTRTDQGGELNDDLPPGLGAVAASLAVPAGIASAAVAAAGSEPVPEARDHSADYDAQMSQLVSEIEAARAEAEALWTVERARLEAQLDEARAMAESARVQHGAALSELAEEHEALVDANRALAAELAVQRERSVREARELAAQHDADLRRQAAAMNSAIKRVQGDAASEINRIRRDDLANLQTSYDELQRKLAAVSRERETLRCEAQLLKRQASDAEALASSARDEHQRALSEAAQLRAELQRVLGAWRQEHEQFEVERQGWNATRLALVAKRK